MADEDLTVKARIDDELSAPLKDIREDVQAVGREAERSGRQASTGSRGWATFGRVGRRALLGLTAAAAGFAYGAARLIKSSITQASDLNESLNAVSVTYGKQTKAVQKLGRQAAKSLGLSNTEFNGLAVRFSAFAKVVGGGGKGTVKALDRLTRRASDFASVMNLEVAESAELFQSGLAGETEPLRKYGIDLSAAKVEAYAYAKGIAATGEQLTESQKVQARYGALMEQTSKTHGDFANTSGELANQQRILGARWDNAQAKLGRGLLPIAKTVVRFLNREGIPAFLRFSDWFNDEGLPALQDFAEDLKPVAEKALPAMADALGIVRDLVKDAAPYAADLIGAFTSAPKWVRTALVGGAMGGIAAKKLGLTGLLKGGAKGLGAIASKAKPLPVWVVNNNGGLPGGPGGGPMGGPSSGPGKHKKGGGLGRGLLRAGKAIPVLGTLAYGWEAGGDEFGAGANAGGSGILGDMSAVREAAKRTREEASATFDLARAKAAGFGKELDLVGARKVEPKIKDDSLKRANEYLANFIGMQVEAGRPVAPYIRINGYAQAMQQISTLTAAVHSIPTAGVDNGASFIGGGGPPRRERGGPVKAGQPYVVGERRAELFVPDRDGTIVPRVSSQAAGGGIVIADGAVRVTVTNPASTVDVKTAVRQAIAEAIRDREERR